MNRGHLEAMIGLQAGVWKCFILFVRSWSLLLQVHVIGKNYLNEVIHTAEVI
jgi:hypothetical protein